MDRYLLNYRYEARLGANGVQLDGVSIGLKSRNVLSQVRPSIQFAEDSPELPLRVNYLMEMRVPFPPNWLELQVVEGCQRSWRKH